MINSQELVSKIKPVTSERIEDYGDILQYALPWAGLLAVALSGNKLAAWIWLYSGLSTTVITLLLKYIFNFTPLGERPNGAPYAFPSGHTSSAFMGAVFIHFVFGIWWAMIAYFLAMFTGYSRIYAGKHHLRDVIAGALLAFLIVYFFIFIIG